MEGGGQEGNAGWLVAPPVVALSLLLRGGVPGDEDDAEEVEEEAAPVHVCSGGCCRTQLMLD